MIPAVTHMENMKLPYLRPSFAAIDVLIFFHWQLSNEEDPPEGTPQVAADAPPPYSSLTVENDGETTPHPHVLFYICVVSGVLLINMVVSKSALKSK